MALVDHNMLEVSRRKAREQVAPRQRLDHREEVIMALGLGAVLVSVTTAANAGVPADKAGLAAGLLNASQQLGTALGLAIFSAIATARTSTLLAAHAPPDAALTAGFHRALLACAVFVLAAAIIALRATNTRGEPAQPSGTRGIPSQVPEPELAD